LKDEVEVMLYNKMFPLMQEFADLKARSEIQMPIPIGNSVNNKWIGWNKVEVWF
jgi:hypothetical protein